MKKPFLKLFGFLTILICFSLNILTVKADTRECKYETDDNVFTVKIVDSKITDVSTEKLAQYSIDKNQTYNSCPSEIFIACEPYYETRICYMSFTKTDKFEDRDKFALSNQVVNNNTNNGNNNTNGSNTTTPGTVLNSVKCGPVKIPELLPNITRMVVLLIQIVVPLILIIMGMLDFAKATIASEEKDITGAKAKFTKRLTAGAVVFFVLAIVRLMVGLIAIDDQQNIMNCVDCLISSSSSCGK